MEIYIGQLKSPIKFKQYFTIQLSIIQQQTTISKNQCYIRNKEKSNVLRGLHGIDIVNRFVCIVDSIKWYKSYVEKY